ncbi:MAG: precorrin-3B C(17)-methyltransferase [Desulfonauticus sp.]|nr:precorrin-3B C(17)-methyltransferase [Desulfonauticus sp.]
MQGSKYSSGQGKLYVLGLGPGAKKHRTLLAEEILRQSQVIVGYEKYLSLVQDHFAGKEIIGSGMRQEVWRVEKALQKALEGKRVTLVSSGDPGIYGMAGLVFEVMQQKDLSLAVEVVPGVSAGQYLAAQVGAPLMLDFACLSLSDILVPWEEIEKRLKALAQIDLVVVLYNPKSKKRFWQLKQALQIFKQYRSEQTWIAVGKNLSLNEEQIFLTTLADLDLEKVDMRTTLIVGNKDTKLLSDWLVTLRGYFKN